LVCQFRDVGGFQKEDEGAQREGGIRVGRLYFFRRIWRMREEDLVNDLFSFSSFLVSLFSVNSFQSAPLDELCMDPTAQRTTREEPGSNLVQREVCCEEMNLRF